MTKEEQERLVLRIEQRVDRFAEMMKSQLHANLHKGDWCDMKPAAIVFEMISTLGELTSDFLHDGIGGDMNRLHKCVNLANYALILADIVVGHLLGGSPPEEENDT